MDRRVSHPVPTVENPTDYEWRRGHVGPGWVPNESRALSHARVKRYDELLTKLENEYHLPSRFLSAVAAQESKGISWAQSGTGCLGLMQFTKNAFVEQMHDKIRERFAAPDSAVDVTKFSPRTQRALASGGVDAAVVKEIIHNKQAKGMIEDMMRTPELSAEASARYYHHLADQMHLRDKQGNIPEANLSKLASAYNGGIGYKTNENREQALYYGGAVMEHRQEMLGKSRSRETSRSPEAFEQSLTHDKRRALQASLNNSLELSGENALKIDGMLGKRTHEAISQWEKSNVGKAGMEGVVADGHISAAEFNTLVPPSTPRVAPVNKTNDRVYTRDRG